MDALCCAVRRLEATPPFSNLGCPPPFALDRVAGFVPGCSVVQLSQSQNVQAAIRSMLLLGRRARISSGRAEFAQVKCPGSTRYSKYDPASLFLKLFRCAFSRVRLPRTTGTLTTTNFYPPHV